jgi:OCT family organic cation transporter-like MFS transporter 4/5
MTDRTSPGGPAPKHAAVKTKTAEEEADDPISQSVGEFGRWQLQLTFLLSLFNIPCTWHIFALTFQSLPSDFWCAKPHDLENISVDEWRNISHTMEMKVQSLERKVEYSLSYD